MILRVGPGEYFWRAILERPMGPTLIVFTPPGLDPLFGSCRDSNQRAVKPSRRNVTLNDSTLPDQAMNSRESPQQGSCSSAMQKVWCPQRDLNPCYCLERAMS
jgi:hypothetical protein